MTERVRRHGSSKGKALDLIRSAGPISRVQLAELTGLTQATISTLVRELLAEGLVSETGRDVSTGGKPRTRLEINPASRLGIGVHLGQDFITYVVTDLAGTVVGRMRVDGPGETPPLTIVPKMAADIESLITGLNVDRSSIVGLGLATPGPIDRLNGTIKGAPSLVGWSDYPLRRELSAATGLPCRFDNDATAAAIGEFWLGATSGYTNYASVYMGTGIGAGIVMDGTIYHGSMSNVGEIGHVSVDANGLQCPCGNVGCVEMYAGPLAVIKKAADAVARGDLDVVLSGTTITDFAAVAELAIKGDRVALGLIEESAEYLASAVVSMINLIDLQLIVLSGSAFSVAGSIYVRTLSSVIGERALARNLHAVDVRMSVNGNDAAALGAATIVLQETLSPRALKSVTPS